ncbi:MAG: ATP-binding protein [Bacteroidaceae bacterium]|nr:ATP-binding protein [Bacteroidaceae bacterium]
MVKNPFVTVGYEGAEYFCDRVEETEKLTKLLRNGNNVLLMSPRRLGKTGLLYHCFAQDRIATDYNTFVIDIYSTKNIDDLTIMMGRSILNALKTRGRKALEHFLNVVSSLRSGITFDLLGNPTWNVEVGSLKSPSFTLEQIFSYLESSEKPCIVAIDEFQQIMYYPEKNVEATLRTYIQRCRNAVFVFSGSERHLLSEMFSSPARPFYASTSTMALDCIDKSKYQEFASNLFEQGGKHLDATVALTVYERFEGITWFVQKVMNYLYAETEVGAVCDVQMIDIAVQEIVKDNSLIYADLLYQLTPRQKELLLAINKEGKATSITGSKFIKRYHLPSPSTIQTAIKALIDKQLVTHTQGIYEVYDKFFSLWLAQSFS